jgi:hypothetical protein
VRRKTTTKQQISEDATSRSQETMARKREQEATESWGTTVRSNSALEFVEHLADERLDLLLLQGSEQHETKIDTL